MNITRLSDGVDGSLQYQFDGVGWKIIACIDKKELILHTWHCEGHGREALREMEAYAFRHELNIAVPCVINAALEVILESSGYKREEEQVTDAFGDCDVIDVWKKPIPAEGGKG